MDGRIQREISVYSTTSFGVRQLDTLTTAGIVEHLANDSDQTETVLADLDMSMDAHASRHIAAVAHHDCAGNPVADKTQTQQIGTAVVWLSGKHPDAEVVGLRIADKWIVERTRS